MLFHKEGYPENSEVVLCTVTKIHSHAVFVEIDEYHKHGMIHISEIAPGRIRNIRDYVRQGKKVVCKVLRINIERGHIDLSLRRVNESQRRLKMEALKQEQVAEKIIETVALRLKHKFKEFYTEVAPKILKHYEMIHLCFNEIVESKEPFLAPLGVEPKVAEAIEAEVRARIQPPVVLIEGILEVTSYAPDGVEIVKEGLKNVGGIKVGEAVIELTYRGSGTYTLKITAPDYKEAETVLKLATDNITGFMKKHDGVATFKRLD